jgi:surface protein
MKKYLVRLLVLTTGFAVFTMALCVPATSHAAGYPANAFVTTWKTDNPGVSNDHQITIPIYQPLSYNYDVDWGDSTSSTGQTGNATHTYSVPGTYTVMITGTFPGIYFNDGGTSDAGKIVTIEQWGTNHWTWMGAAFAGCGNLVINATDVPDLSGVTSTGYMFLNAALINPDVSSWDVSHITDMYGMFQSARAFNHDVSSWDVSHVTNMSYMFENATAFNNGGQPLSWGSKTGNVSDMGAMFMLASSFNQDVSGWDISHVGNIASMFHAATSFNNGGHPLTWGNKTASVTNMQNVFNGATSFNQDIGNWNTSNVTTMYYMFHGATSFNQNINNWNVGNVTDMNNMFSLAMAFNQPLGNWNMTHVGGVPSMFEAAASFNQDLSNWDTSSITGMADMFFGATSFDQNLGSWDIAQVGDMSDMFTNSGLSTENYDAMLHGWASQSVQSGVAFGVGATQYCTAGTSRTGLITNHNWTISDGGLQDGCTKTQPAHHYSTVIGGHIAIPQINNETSVSVLPTVSPIQFLNNLKLGDNSMDVLKLQQYLNNHDSPVAISGLGSKGQETNYFGSLTKQALIKFQSMHGIPATGFFGPMTRGYVNSNV